MGALKCIKYLVFVFNFLFWLAGTRVLAVGLWLRFDSRTAGLFEGDDSPSVFFTGVYILIAAGALMMVVGFLGCCGAIKESPWMLGSGVSPTRTRWWRTSQNSTSRPTTTTKTPD